MTNDSGRLRSAGLRPEPEEVSALRAAVAIARFTPGPWFAGRLVLADDDDDFGTISIGQQDLSERPNKDAHYEDTIAEVWQNPNLSEDAEANAALIASAPRLYRELEAAGAIFRAYEALHLEKGTEEGVAKAKRNAAFADTIERVLAEARGDTPNVSGLSHTGVDR